MIKIFAVCAISAGYVIFELHALNNKFKLYENNFSELKIQESAERKENEYIWNTISRLEKQIEDLRVEFKTQNDQEKTKNEDFQKELIRLDWHLQREIDRLQNKQEVTKIKMEKLNTDIKNRDDILKDLDKKANSLHDVLQNTVNEMEKLLGQVASMDDQILDLRDRITTLSRSEYHWLLKKTCPLRGYNSTLFICDIYQVC